MTCPVCPGKVHHPNGLKGTSEGVCPRQDEIKVWLENRAANPRTNYYEGCRNERTKGKQPRPEDTSPNEQIARMVDHHANLAKAKAAKSTIDGSDGLVMFSFTKQQVNMAIVHPTDTVELNVARWFSMRKVW